MKFNTQYWMDDDHIGVVEIYGDGLQVQLIPQQDGNFEYRSWDRYEKKGQIASHHMSLPACLLHAAEFFGMIPPGIITEDIFNGCEYRF